MKPKSILLLLMLSTMVGLTGCAQNAGIHEMTSWSQPVMTIKNPLLIDNISVSQVKGGKESNPLWTSQINNANFQEALINSLKNAHLFQEQDPSNYELRANLIELKQPSFGIDLTVSCKVHYTILNTETKKPIFDQAISSSYTAQFGDSLHAGTRLRMANEGAAQKNIQKLIEMLYRLPKL